MEIFIIIKVWKNANRMLISLKQITITIFLAFIYTTNQGLLYTWTDSLGTFLVTFVIMKISKNDSNIICRSSKNITFSKIWRVWLKNWARHAHFNFKLLKGMAVLLSELCPSNFGQSQIFYRPSIDILINFL